MIWGWRAKSLQLAIVGGTGFEPVRPKTLVFKTSASTNSASRDNPKFSRREFTKV